jgi:hypothetical protein
MVGKWREAATQKYFDDVDILTARPEGMDYDEYKARMRAQKKVIKQYLKGEMFHVSKLYPHPEILKQLGVTEGMGYNDIFMTAMKTGDANMMLLVKGRTYEKRNDV